MVSNVPRCDGCHCYALGDLPGRALPSCRCDPGEFRLTPVFYTISVTMAAFLNALRRDDGDDKYAESVTIMDG